jgi:hypothetical protein
MTGTSFPLALLPAVNPELFAVDPLLIENARPQLMFTCFLLGGLGSASAGPDLVLRAPLAGLGVLVATGRQHGRRKAPAPAGDGQLRKRTAGAVGSG